MKISYYNHHLELEAEDERDTDWLNEFTNRLDNLNILSNYFTFDVGNVDDEGKIQIEASETSESENENTELDVQEAKDWIESCAANIVRINFSPFGRMIGSWVKKALEKDLKKFSKSKKETIT